MFCFYVLIVRFGLVMNLHSDPRAPIPCTLIVCRRIPVDCEKVEPAQQEILPLKD